MGTLMERIEGLSEEAQAKVVEFVEFLEFSESKRKAKTTKRKRTTGTLKGHLKYMADDFDETPECFKEYM